MNLDELGTRICILGPSNSGKSTLAVAIGRANDLPVVHLDQLRHLPGTQWELRSDDEFSELHDAAIPGNRWVIEGNYSSLMPQRFERATGLIVIDSSTPASLIRYARRTLIPGNRIGGLEGTQDRLSFNMVQYILGPARSNRSRYRRILDEATCPKIFLPNRRSLKLFYRAQGLSLRLASYHRASRRGRPN